MAFTGVAAIAAATAASLSSALALPVWAMFIGWVAFFTRGLTLKDGLANLACVWFGIAVGMGAAMAIGALTPAWGLLALPAVVFLVAVLVVSLRAVPVLNNILCYFLGLIAYFASHLPPSQGTFVLLGLAVALGSIAGLVALQLQNRLPRAA
nr:DUF1097 domain-containing protein [uncultured Albidiferax sp.]